MSTGLNGIKDLPYFLLGSALLLGTMLLINKGCAYYGGAYDIQNIQVAEIKAFGVPDTNIKVVEFFRSTPDYSNVWTDYSYETTLSQEVIVNFYSGKFLKKNWEEGKSTKELNPNNEELTALHWKRDREKLTLTFRKSPSLDKTIYTIMIDWHR